MARHPQQRRGGRLTPDQASLVLEELGYVWRLSLTQPEAHVRAYLRHRIDQVVEDAPTLAAKHEHLLSVVRAISAERGDA